MKRRSIGDWPLATSSSRRSASKRKRKAIKVKMNKMHFNKNITDALVAPLFRCCVKINYFNVDSAIALTVIDIIIHLSVPMISIRSRLVN